MILAAGAPLEPFGRPLRALYVSLNSPVVTLESLATGPARAAVALHEAGATLCVRSLRSGHLQLFATTEALAGDRRVALDAALSFAESMGFLFDEDEVARRGDAGPEEAARLWRELCGEEAEPPDGPDAEILLEELVPAAHEGPAAPPADVEVPSLPAPAPGAGDPEMPVVPPAHVLSKFRRTGAAAGAGAERAGPPDVRLRLMSRF